MRCLYSDSFILRGFRGEYQTDEVMPPSFLECLIVLTIKVVLIVLQGLFHIGSRIPVADSILDTTTRCYSRGAVGFFLRGAYWNTKIDYMGQDVFIDVGVTIWEPSHVRIGSRSHIDTYVTILGGKPDSMSHVHIGEYVHIASNVVLAGRGGIDIGDHAAVASGSGIYSGSLYYDDGITKHLWSMSAQSPEYLQNPVEKLVVMKPYSVVLLHSSVLPGVTIGSYAVVGAHSLVTKDIGDYAVAVGTPAKVIKYRPHPTEPTPVKDDRGNTFINCKVVEEE